MQDFAQNLALFDSITLAEMDTVKLLNRVETKYTFSKRILNEVLEDLQGSYRILEINTNRVNHYRTLYFDTIDHKMYMAHHNGRGNRYKVRFRQYCDSSLNFFEIKFKNNKGRVIKDRVKRTEFSREISGKSLDLLNSKTPMMADDLIPSISIYYTRITLVNKDMTERLTIDTGLKFKHEDKEISLPNLVIAELKQGKQLSSPFKPIMQKFNVRTLSISKYCYGVANLVDNIKSNNFKAKIIKINKLAYENS